MEDYLVPRVDGSIIPGGAKATMSKDTSVWYDDIDDNDLIEPAKKYFDNYMQRRFVGWEERGASVDTVWTGNMPRLPFTKLPRRSRPYQMSRFFCSPPQPIRIANHLSNWLHHRLITAHQSRPQQTKSVHPSRLQRPRHACPSFSSRPRASPV